MIRIGPTIRVSVVQQRTRTDASALSLSLAPSARHCADAFFSSFAAPLRAVLLRPNYSSGKGGERSRQRFEELRTDAEKTANYIEDVLKKVEEKKQTFSAFIVTKIRDAVQPHLQPDGTELSNLVRELRDLYFLYSDCLHNEIRVHRDMPHDNLDVVSTASALVS